MSRLSIVMHRRNWRGGPLAVRLLVVGNRKFAWVALCPTLPRKPFQLICCCSMSLLSLSSLSFLPFFLSSSRPVAIAKLIVAVWLVLHLYAFLTILLADTMCLPTVALLKNASGVDVAPWKWCSRVIGRSNILYQVNIDLFRDPPFFIFSS